MPASRDKPPVLRVLVLLIALVSTALALAALSPPRPDGAEPDAAPQPATVAAPAADNGTARR